MFVYVCLRVCARVCVSMRACVRWVCMCVCVCECVNVWMHWCVYATSVCECAREFMSVYICENMREWMYWTYVYILIASIESLFRCNNCNIYKQWRLFNYKNYYNVHIYICSVQSKYRYVLLSSRHPSIEKYLLCEGLKDIHTSYVFQFLFAV